MIRVVLPQHLRTLANVGREVTLDVAPPVTQRSVLDALEARYPMLRGTVRDHVTQKRRALVRFFAAEADLSNEPPDDPLPEAVASGAEPYFIIGAIAGGWAVRGGSHHGLRHRRRPAPRWSQASRSCSNEAGPRCATRRRARGRSR